jgi:hypothetical protein
MNRIITWLAAALAFQLLLSAVLLWPRENIGEEDAREALFSFAPDSVDRLVISDSEHTVLVARGDDGWRLPEYHNLSVDESRLTRAITDLPALPRGWPVANTAGAAERFEVAEDAFQRKVAYFDGESALGTLYLGTSPGFRKVHVRIPESDSIYAVNYNSFDLPATPAEWLDKTLLQVRDIQAVTGLDYSLRRDGETWLGDGEQPPAADVVEDLVNGLRSLRVTRAADITTASVLEEMAAPPTLTVEADGESYEFRLFEIEEDYYIQRLDIPVYFSLSAFDYDRLNDVNADALYPADEAEEKADMETGEGGSSDQTDDPGDTD